LDKEIMIIYKIKSPRIWDTWTFPN